MLYFTWHIISIPFRRSLFFTHTCTLVCGYGTVGAGEDFKETAFRELLEETGKSPQLWMQSMRAPVNYRLIFTPNHHYTHPITTLLPSHHTRLNLLSPPLVVCTDGCGEMRHKCCTIISVHALCMILSGLAFRAARKSCTRQRRRCLVQRPGHHERRLSPLGDSCFCNAQPILSAHSICVHCGHSKVLWVLVNVYVCDSRCRPRWQQASGLPSHSRTAAGNSRWWRWTARRPETRLRWKASKVARYLACRKRASLSACGACPSRYCPAMPLLLHRHKHPISVFCFQS